MSNITFREFLAMNEGFKGTFLKSIPLTAAILGTNYMAGSPLDRGVEAIVDRFVPPEYISKKTVIPYDLIRNSQSNKDKWDQDFSNLKTPILDKGYATHKDKFYKPITVYVYTDAKLKEFSPTAMAFASGNNVLLSDKLFVKLPTRTSDGILTQQGVAALSHELRHTTQNYSAVPSDMRQNHEDSDMKHFFNKYMNDPQEVGVRVAALKNLLSKKTFEDALQTINVDLDSKNLIISELQDEKLLLHNLFHPEMWAKKLSVAYSRNQPKMFQDVSYEKTFARMIDAIKKHIKTLNSDARQLLDFLETMPDEEKEVFLKNMIEIYDQVVQKSNFSKQLYKV